ncbi:HNH endonuclease [Akkermansia sp. AKK6]
MISSFHSLLTMAAMRCGWENWDEQDGGEVLRLHSVLYPGRVLVSQEGDNFRIVPDIPGAELEVQNVRPDCLDAALISLAKQAGDDVPSATQTESLAQQRLGQARYRAALMALWNGACALTGVDIPELLRASHAKPWSNASDRERLDPFNGVLLEARFDLLFDQGLISFNDDGTIITSVRLSADHCYRLGITPDMSLRFIRPAHLPYLAWHRERVFQGGSA